MSEQAVRRERRWLIPILLLTQLGALVVAAVLLLVFGDESIGTTELLILFAALVVLLVAIDLTLLAVYRWRRRRGTTLFATSPLWELPTRRERAALTRALRRGDPIPPEQLDLARRTARDMVGRRGLVWLNVGMAVLFLANGLLQLASNGIGGMSFLFSGIPFVVALLALVNAGYFAWLLHRMRLALARLDATDRPA